MKAKVHTVILAAAMLAVSASSPASEKAHSQQDKFAHCAHESKGLKGEERTKFMSECLKSHDGHEGEKAKTAPASKPTAVKEARNDAEHHQGQQGKMKACNEEAGRKDLHGEERRAFMSSCLKAH